jgi:hypothetical protein
VWFGAMRGFLSKLGLLMRSTSRQICRSMGRFVHTANYGTQGQTPAILGCELWMGDRDASGSHCDMMWRYTLSQCAVAVI